MTWATVKEKLYVVNLLSKRRHVPGVGSSVELDVSGFEGILYSILTMRRALSIETTSLEYQFSWEHKSEAIVDCLQHSEWT
ncbi:hypothetical protein GOP47_0004869 [Adiantum capillus-veneris]|uniref:Uncharacterized protein n=1 Tax=Adiantum capillus-veneris TaxID=13818 RepID=A0A9D4ZNL9_ADICA|nr:hypothetical protein GOP47_0004869 [Adiantum capillus-veneris]